MQVPNLIRISVIGWIGITLIIAASGIEYFTKYYMRRATTDWLVTASKANDATSMARYIDNALLGLETWRMDKGHSAIWFQRPITDLRISYQTLQNTLERTQAVAAKYESPDSPCLKAGTCSRNDQDYSQALLDLRLTISSGGISYPPRVVGASTDYFWRIRTGIPVEIMFYGGSVLLTFALLRPLLRRPSWPEVGMLSLFFLTMFYAIWSDY